MRSGLLQSVHSFASDPQKALFMGILTVFLLLITLGYHFYYGSFLPRKSSKEHYGKGMAFSKKWIWNQRSLINVQSILWILAYVFLSFTLVIPFIMEILGKGTVTLEPDFYHVFFRPWVVVLFLVMMFVGHVYGSIHTLKTLWLSIFQKYSFSGATGIVCMIAGVFLKWPWYGVILVSLSMMIMIQSTIMVLKARHTWPLCLAHSAVALCLLGMTWDHMGQESFEGRVSFHERIPLGNYELFLENIEWSKHPRYDEERAGIRVEKNKNVLGRIYPGKRLYSDYKMMTTQTAQMSVGPSHIYVALGPQGGQKWTVRAYWHPGVQLIWWGGFLMGLVTIVLALRRKKTHGATNANLHPRG